MLIKSKSMEEDLSTKLLEFKKPLAFLDFNCPLPQLSLKYLYLQLVSLKYFEVNLWSFNLLQSLAETP